MAHQSSSSGAVRLLLRAPPHLPFIQGWPGITAAERRAAATVQGTVEVRLGHQAVKAKWVRVEVRKHESVPAGLLPGKASSQSTWTHVGKVHVLWKAGEGKEYDQLGTADFRFVIPLPQDLAPTVDLGKGLSVRYELVASVCYKGKGGLFKKDSSSIATIGEPLRIVKHELASAWPAYNQPEQRRVTSADNTVSFIVDRSNKAFGPSDRVVVGAVVQSMSPQALRFKGFDLALLEVVTVFPPPEVPGKKKPKVPPQPTIKRTVVASSRANVGGILSRGQEIRANLDLVVPTDRQLLTVTHAKEFAVAYELAIEALFDGSPGKISMGGSMGGFDCTIGTFSKSSAQQAIRDIGYVEGLCPRPPPGQQAQPPMGVPGAPPPMGHQQNPSMSGQGQGQLFPPRQTSSPSNGRLGVTQSVYGRPLSMVPQGSPPSNEPELPSFTQNSPPNAGFTPRDHNRRSSSGTTATTTTITTDHGPPLSDRNVATLPNNFRASVGFPTPSPHLNGQRTPEPDKRTSVDDIAVDSLRARAVPGRSAQSDIGHKSTFSMATNTTFGGWHPSVYDRIVDEEEPSSQPPSPTATASSATGPTMSSARQSPVPPRQPAWPVVPATSQRLTASASSHSVRGDEPPGYAPPAPLALSTAGRPGMLIPINRDTPPLSAVGTGPSFSRGTPPVAMSPVTSSPSRSQLGHGPYPSATQEKDMARLKYEEATRRVASNGSASNGPDTAPAASDIVHGAGYVAAGSAAAVAAGSVAAVAAAALGRSAFRDSYVSNGSHNSGNSAGVSTTAPAAAAPVPASIPNEDPIPYDDLFGAAGSSSAPAAGASSGAPAPASEPFRTAAQEKDDMRKRYENAQTAVARTAGAETPPPGIMSPVMTASPGRADSPPPAASGSSNNNFSPTRSASTVPAAYMTAAQEKDLMRRRFEEAQNAVARSQDSPSGSPEMLSGSQLATAPPVGLGIASGSSPAPPPVTSTPAPAPAAYMSAAEEKDLMRRRFEEAQNRVNRGTSPTGEGSASAAPAPIPVYIASTPTSPSTAATSSKQQSPATYKSAAEEKEEMKLRYERATMGVARAAGESPSGPSDMGMSPAPAPIGPLVPVSNAPVPTEAPIPYDELFGSAGAAGSSSAGPSVPVAAASSPAPYMSAAEEKDMMRRRFEDAQNRVNRVASGQSPTSSNVSPSSATGTVASALRHQTIGPRDEDPIPYDQAVGPSSSGSSSRPPVAAPVVPAAYRSAAEEKEEMRLRYERATMGVARATGATSPPPFASSSPGLMHSSPDSSTYGHSAINRSASERATSPPPPPPADAGGSSRAPPYAAGGGYMSAEAEKDAMRRRYERATGAVASPASVDGHHHNHHGFGSVSGVPKPMRSATASTASTNNISPSSSSSSPFAPRDPRGGPPAVVGAGHKGKARAMTALAPLPDGPPPPLAPRPPREYIERI